MQRSLRWMMLVPFFAAAVCVNAVSAGEGHGNGPKLGQGQQGDNQGGNGGNGSLLQLRATLVGRQEVPTVISDAHGTFRATVSAAGDSISYVLTYADLEGNVTQSHIHVGQRFAAGGISAFLCSNLPNPPAGTQACPSPPAQIS